jgi:hypothetical protein
MTKRGPQEGSVLSQSLILLFVLLIGLSALFLTVSTVKVYVRGSQERFKGRVEAENFLISFGLDLQSFAQEEFDHPDGDAYLSLLGKYAPYECVLEDASSGFCLSFMPYQELRVDALENSLFLTSTSEDFIQRVHTRGPITSMDEYTEYIRADALEQCVVYGWMSPKRIDTPGSCFLESFNQDVMMNGNIVHSFPSINVNFAQVPVISHFIRQGNFKLTDPEGRIRSVIAGRERGPLDGSQLISMLGVQKNNPILQILGVKTCFWKVRGKVSNHKVEGVYAVILSDTDGNIRIDGYELIEKRIHNE